MGNSWDADVCASIISSPDLTRWMLVAQQRRALVGCSCLPCGISMSRVFPTAECECLRTFSGSQPAFKRRTGLSPFWGCSFNWDCKHVFFGMGKCMCCYGRTADLLAEDELVRWCWNFQICHGRGLSWICIDFKNWQRRCSEESDACALWFQNEDAGSAKGWLRKGAC